MLGKIGGKTKLYFISSAPLVQKTFPRHCCLVKAVNIITNPKVSINNLKYGGMAPSPFCQSMVILRVKLFHW